MDDWGGWFIGNVQFTMLTTCCQDVFAVEVNRMKDSDKQVEFEDRVGVDG